MKNKLKRLLASEFARRGYGRGEDDELVYALFSEQCLWLFIKFMFDMGMDPESAYELLRQDKRTLDALHEDAVKFAGDL